MGNGYTDMTEGTDMMAALESACASETGNAAHWRALGGYCAARHDFGRARSALERALSLEPEHDDCAALLGWVLNEIGETRLAMQVLTPGTAGRAVSFGRRVRAALLLPQVYDSGEALAQWRNRYSEGLTDLRSDLSKYCPDARRVFDLNQSNFLLAYQGRDDIDLQRQYAGMLGELISRADPGLVRPRMPRAVRQRLRVAFVSGFLRECTIGHYFRSWIEELDRKRFEVVVIYTGSEADATTHALGAAAAKLVVSPGGALTIAQAVSEVAPDILIYPEVGMQASSYLLACMRLAPVQCAAWGHPVTTGSSQIDYFFTCADMEPSDGDRHYTECLLPLPGIGTCYRRPEVMPSTIGRESFGLTRDVHLYVCPQSLFKVHPDNDGVYLDIIEADPQAVLVFFQETGQQTTMAFANRLARGMAARKLPQRRQVKFLPRLDAAGFRAVLNLADVILDTLHWSGGNTSLDALSVGAPIVTLPGRFMRGRQSKAMLEVLELPELIAGGTGEMVATALRIARDADIRHDLRQHILTRVDALFDQVEPIRALEAHLERLGRGDVTRGG
jgi:protein O-GlcNAc transferase